jgi:hypothetical protein
MSLRESVTPSRIARIRRALQMVQFYRYQVSFKLVKA